MRDATMAAEPAPHDRTRPTRLASIPAFAASLLLVFLCAALPVARAGEAADVAPEPETERVTTVPEGVPSLRMSTDFTPPGLTLGTYAPMGHFESRGVRVAPFTIRAALETALGYDNNVGLTQNDRVGSMFLNLTPSVALGLENPLHRYYIAYRGNYGVYTSSSGDNYEDHNIALTAANSWTARLRTRFVYEFLRGHTARGATRTARSEQLLWHTHVLRASGSYGAEGARGRIEADAGYRDMRYLTSRAVRAPLDYEELEIGGAFHYRVAPKTRLVLRVSHADIDHPHDPSRDNVEMRYSIGATWEALAATEGTAAVGYTTKNYDSSLRSDTSTPSYELRLRWSPRVDSTLTATARRSYSESAEAGTTYVVNSLASLGWDQRWQRGIRSSLLYDYGHLRYDTADRTDVYQRLGVRGTYPLGRSLRAGAEFRYDTRNAEATGLDYRRSLILLTLETAL